MDIQKSEGAPGLFTRRFWAREVLAGAENQGSALLYSVLMFATALLFAQTHALFGAYPFALGLLAACDRRVPLAFAGACIGALMLGERGYIYCGAYLLTLLLRLLVSRPREEGRIFPASYEYFEEAPALRAATACVSGLSLGLYQLIAGGMAVESLAFAATMILAPTVVTVCYLGYFESGRSLLSLLTEENVPTNRHLTAADWYLALGVGSVFFTVVLGAGNNAIFGISLSCCLASFACLFLPQKWGIVRGGITAVAVSLGTLSFSYVPAFACMAILSGLLRSVGLFYALAAACTGGTVLAFAFTGLTALVGFLPETVVSAAVAWPLFRNLPELTAEGNARRRRERAEATEEARRRLPVVERMQMLADAYQSLSEIFWKLSDAAAHPCEAEYERACREVFDRYCDGCAGHAGCFEKGDKNAERALACLCEQYARGTPPPDIHVPDSLMRSCGCFDRILGDIRQRCAALEEEKRRSDRNGVFAQNYSMMAEMLTDASRREVREGREEPELSRQARRIFEEMGAPVRHVSVFGSRHRFILADGVRWDAERNSEEELRGRLEELCHCRLSPAVFESRNGGMRLRLESARRLCAVVHQATAARGREVSGDAFSTFEGQGDYGYALLSDGMGSGREAAITAGICGAFLRQILAAGISKSSALRALNTVLCERGAECSATIDLLELDLLYGKACFVKSGAAASYVKRGENLFRIRSSTVPIGILRALDAEKIRFDVQAGDLIVMLSDGISQVPEDAAWLCEILAGPCEGDLDALAEKILDIARGRMESGGDDMTVALIEIKAA